MPWWMEAAAASGAAAVWIVGRSWRCRTSGAWAPAAALERGERCIYAFWHARLLPLVFAERHRGAAVLVSRSRDGELIARIIERLGYTTARGSSSRGGREGLLEMLSWAERGRLLAVTPDGPRGPAEVVKPGLVWLASHTGRPVVPAAAAADRAWVARSWDRFRVPLPFARIEIAYGPPIEVPAGLEDEGVEAWRRRIEESLRRLTAEVAARAGEPA
jgi:lysophospholipid acyltransferase (LPLAT)-like uncharacterized protein